MAATSTALEGKSSGSLSVHRGLVPGYVSGTPQIPKLAGVQVPYMT